MDERLNNLKNGLMIAANLVGLPLAMLMDVLTIGKESFTRGVFDEINLYRNRIGAASNAEKKAATADLSQSLNTLLSIEFEGVAEFKLVEKSVSEKLLKDGSVVRTDAKDGLLAKKEYLVVLKPVIRHNLTAEHLDPEYNSDSFKIREVDLQNAAIWKQAEVVAKKLGGYAQDFKSVHTAIKEEEALAAEMAGVSVTKNESDGLIEQLVIYSAGDDDANAAARKINAIKAQASKGYSAIKPELEKLKGLCDGTIIARDVLAIRDITDARIAKEDAARLAEEAKGTAFTSMVKASRATKELGSVA